MITAKQIHEIAKTVIEQGYDFDYVGLRVQESDYGVTVGQEINHESSHWIDGTETDETVGGICAIDARAAAAQILGFGAYSGKVVLVLGSKRFEYGEDPGEIILRPAWGQNPTVLDIIQL